MSRRDNWYICVLFQIIDSGDASHSHDPFGPIKYICKSQKMKKISLKIHLEPEDQNSYKSSKSNIKKKKITQGRDGGIKPPYVD